MLGVMSASHSGNGSSSFTTSGCSELTGSTFTCHTVFNLVVVSAPPSATSRIAGSSSALMWRAHTSRYTMPSVLSPNSSVNGGGLGKSGC